VSIVKTILQPRINTKYERTPIAESPSRSQAVVFATVDGKTATF